MNGPINGGRPVGALSGGRAVATMMSSWAGNTAGLSRGGGFCPPLPQCCCQGPWSIAPGETLPLVIQWQRWIDSVPGYLLQKITEADLYDMTVNPPGPADPDLIRLDAGPNDEDDDDDGNGDDEDDEEEEEPEPNPNEDVAAAIALQPPYITHTLVAVSLAAPIGKQFRLRLAVTARDCDGRKITMRDCVVIVVAEC